MQCFWSCKNGVKTNVIGYLNFHMIKHFKFKLIFTLKVVKTCVCQLHIFTQIYIYMFIIHQIKLHDNWLIYIRFYWFIDWRGINGINIQLCTLIYNYM